MNRPSQEQLLREIARATKALLDNYDRLGFLPGYELRILRELLAQLR